MNSKPHNIPNKPGVYLFSDKKSEILYIGKASNLQKRISSYFRDGQNLDIKTRSMVKQAENIEYIITDNETEALILENILIKKHKPRFNIKLRDDKNYQYIALDYTTEIPQIYPVRNRYLKSEKKQLKLYGPYTSGKKVRYVLKLVKQIFSVCTAKQKSARPCFNYQLHRCPGVCIGEVPLEKYRDSFKQIELFLQGHTSVVKKNLKRQMKTAANEKQYEKAAQLRDQLESLLMLSAEQKIISTKNINRDYISAYQKNSFAAVNLFKVREGRLSDREIFILENLDENLHKKDILSVFIQRFYADNFDIPKNVYVETLPDNADSLTALLQKYANERDLSYKPILHEPKRGESKKVINLGLKNAQNYLEKKSQNEAKLEKRALLGMQQLQQILKLPNKPKRIEAFDISNIQGANAVGSMIVFENGLPNKSQYRRFRIKTKTTPDDYTMMQEVVKRRLHNDWPKPDLIVIDGGKGQLNIAKNVLSKENWDTPVISLAKPQASKQENLDKIFTPENEAPIRLHKDNPALQMLQNIRDEAHRFAITYHKKLRSKTLINRE